jgi:hypothetical protein
MYICRLLYTVGTLPPVQVISKLLEDARAAKLVVQVSDAREPPAGHPLYSIDRLLTAVMQQR